MAIILGIIALVWMIIGFFKKRIEPFIICLLAASIVGIIFSLYTIQSGRSQMYFLMGIQPLVSFAGVYSIEQIGHDKSINSKTLYIICVVLTLLTFGQSSEKYYLTIVPKIREGADINRLVYSAEDYNGYCIDAEEYEVCEWLRDNTDEDCLIALDSHVYFAGKENSMIVGVFTERYIWNEEKYLPDIIEGERRSDIMQQIWCDPNRTIQILREEVDYVLVMIGDNKPDLCSMVSDVNEVYRNLYYVVYSI